MNKTAVFLSLCAAAVVSISVQGIAQSSGKAGTLIRNTKEFVLQSDNPSSSFSAGQKLYASQNGVNYTIEIVAVTGTGVKCRVTDAAGKELTSVPAGIAVMFSANGSRRDRGTAGAVKTVGGVEFVYIPGGSFVMGSNADGENYYLGEGVPHTVKVSPFWISRYEITQNQYIAVMKKNPSPSMNADFPVENVSWNDAVEFSGKFSSMNKVKARIPYEAEWEYAARAGTATKYYWGDEIDGDYCWYADNSGGKAHKVGTKKPNSFGLFDMSGNVCEWVQDWYDEGYYRRSPSENPKGPSSGEKKILRGGSYVNLPMHPSPMRSDIRITDQPSVKREGWGVFGIRLVIEE